MMYKQEFRPFYCLAPHHFGSGYHPQHWLMVHTIPVNKSEVDAYFKTSDIDISADPVPVLACMDYNRGEKVVILYLNKRDTYEFVSSRNHPYNFSYFVAEYDIIKQLIQYGIVL